MTKARNIASAAPAPAGVTSTELGYIDGVTSAIQTQMDAKLATSTAASTYVPNSLADAKGDLIVGTADNTISKLTTGSNGQSLVADSTTTTGLRWQDSQAAGKNAVINGGMDIWQRGTSFTNVNVGGFNADRFLVNRSGDEAGFNISRSTDVPDGFVYSMKWQRASSNASATNSTLYYGLESLDSYKFKGQTATLSFYAKKGANYSGGGLSLALGSGTATDARPFLYTNTVASSGGVTLNTTWTRYSITGTFPSNTTQAFFAMSWTPSGTAGADDSVYLTGLQLEVGSVATPFSRAGGTIQGELAACQRYYQRYKADSVFDDLGYSGKATSSTVIYAGRTPYVPFRVTPTAVDYANVAWIISWGAGTTGVSAIALSAYVSADTPLLTFTTTGLTAGTTYILLAGNTADAYIGLSAEL